MILLRLLKNPYFLLGFLVISGMLVGSFIHQYAYDSEIKQTMWLLDENNDLIDSAPLPPSKDNFLGTDRDGYDLFMMLLLGAKYTLIFAFMVALLRVLLSLAVGILYGTFFMKYKRYIDGLVDAFHYIPITLISIFILAPIILETPMGFTYSFTERLVLQALILTLLAVPITSVLIGNEINEILKREFILGAKTLGGSKFHILWKHVRPHLFARLAIIYGQQVVQVLLVLVHLGLFSLFLGGTDICYGCPGAEPKTMTYEWSGMLGNSHLFIQTNAKWIFYAPIIFFAVSILAMNFMIEGFKRVVNDRSYLMTKAEKKRKHSNKQTIEVTTEMFELNNGTNYVGRN
jgi:peptide/nickel transport system permease protein